MCKGQCNRNTEKVLCTNGGKTGSGVPIDTAQRNRTVGIDSEGTGTEDVFFTYTELYSATANEIILLIKTVVNDTRPGGTSYTTPVNPPTFTFGICQRCPLDSFDVDCQDSPQGYCCIKDQVIEDACRKLKG